MPARRPVGGRHKGLMLDLVSGQVVVLFFLTFCRQLQNFCLREVAWEARAPSSSLLHPGIGPIAAKSFWMKKSSLIARVLCFISRSLSCVKDCDALMFAHIDLGRSWNIALLVHLFSSWKGTEGEDANKE